MYVILWCFVWYVHISVRELCALCDRIYLKEKVSRCIQNMLMPKLTAGLYKKGKKKKKKKYSCDFGMIRNLEMLMRLNWN